MFNDVSKMNLAFGNPKGDPNNIDWDRLTAQCVNIAKNVQGQAGEVEELYQALEARDSIGVRDALCDIMVFTLGAFHLMGADADSDMKAVFESNMSKFCRNVEELGATMNKYENLDLKVYAEGVYPFVCVKSAEDQMDRNGKHYSKGKFLKGVGFQEPAFTDVFTSPV